VVVIAVLTLLALIGLIVFKCVRSRRARSRRKLQLAAVIDSSTTPTAALQISPTRTSAAHGMFRSMPNEIKLCFHWSEKSRVFLLHQKTYTNLKSLIVGLYVFSLL